MINANIVQTIKMFYDQLATNGKFVSFYNKENEENMPMTRSRSSIKNVLKERTNNAMMLANIEDTRTKYTLSESFQPYTDQMRRSETTSPPELQLIPKANLINTFEANNTILVNQSNQTLTNQTNNIISNSTSEPISVTNTVNNQTNTQINLNQTTNIFVTNIQENVENISIENSSKSRIEKITNYFKPAKNKQNNEKSLEWVSTPQPSKSVTKPKLSNHEQINLIKNTIQQVGLVGDASIKDVIKSYPFSSFHIKNRGYVLPLEQLENSLVWQDSTYLVDKNVHEISHDEIKPENPYWNELIESISEKIVKQMGCAGETRAELDKMVLYEAGSSIQRQASTQDSRIFGKLIVQLPSRFTGGEFVVYERNKVKTLDFGQLEGSSSYLIHYAAYFADLEYKMMEVTSGYRLVLVYNLCWAEKEGKLLKMSRLVEQMHEVLDSFSESKIPLGMALSGAYDSDSFVNKGVQALNELDFKRYELIEQASEMLTLDKQMEFKLVHLKLTVFNKNQEEVNEASKKPKKASAKIKKKVDQNDILEIREQLSLAGTSWAKEEISLKMGHFEQIFDPRKDLSEKLSLNDEKEWEHLSVNQEDKKVYDKYVLMFMPKPNEPAAASNTNKNSLEKPKIESLIEKMSSNSKTKAHLANMETIVNYLIETEDMSLILKFISKIEYNNEHARSLAKLIQKLGWSSSFSDSISRFTHPITGSNFKVNCELVKTLMNLNESEKAYMCFKDCIEPVLKDKEKFKSILNEENCADCHYDLLEAILLFKKRDDFKSLMDQYKDLLRPRAEYLRKLIHFVEDKNDLRMFEAKLDDDFKEIESFLRSNELELNLNNFKFKYEAEEFEKKLKPMYKPYKNFEHGFSIQIKIEGSRSQTVLTIKKTDDYRKHKKKSLQEFKKELAKLNSIL